MGYLVTGATGFIGRHLMAQLLTLGVAAEVHSLVDPKARAREEQVRAAYRTAGVRLIEGDLATGDVQGPPPSRVDVVFHLAANVDTAASGTALDVNDRGTRHLLEWLGERARGARIVYASSVAVHDRRGTSDRRPITETSPFHPRTDYGRTKLRGEQILQTEATSRGYTYTILRLATVYGPDRKPGGLFDRFERYAENGSFAGRLDWPGRTSVLHADEAAALMIAVAQRPEAANEVYCAAHPTAPTVGELARAIGHAMGRPVEPIRPPQWVWRLTRAVACSPVVFKLAPRPLRQSLWRLSLVVDDGFWIDPSKLAAVCPPPQIPLPVGLAGMIEGARTTVERSRTPSTVA